MMNRRSNDTTLNGFTLPEIMIALTVFGLVTIGLVSFTLDSSRSLFWATNKSLITKDVRNFTMRLTNETLGARAAFVYPSFTTGDRNEKEDQRQTGESGDCLVLIYYDPYPDIDDDEHYTKIIVFFRRPESDGLSPVYRAEVEFDPPLEIDTSGGTNHFETLLASHFPNDQGDFPVVLELSRGLANGRLFRNFGNATYVVNGEILHGNKVKEVTNTYNLTISPRG